MQSVDSPQKTELSDGVIFLRPLTADDAEEHLAGEDEEMAKWLSGGHSTAETVKTFLERNEQSWRTGGPRRAFGIRDCQTGRLIGSIEMNTAFPELEPGQVNVSYGIFPQWRGRGLVLRAIKLMAEYLRRDTKVSEILLRISPENIASLKVAERAGFAVCGVFDEAEGQRVRWVRKLGV